jgi:serine/threonine protein kinase
MDHDGYFPDKVNLLIAYYLLLLDQAESLTKIHHKNIVTLIGYCKDSGCMALVYEYMSGGTLKDKLRGTVRPIPPVATKDSAEFFSENNYIFCAGGRRYSLVMFKTGFSL